MMAAIKQVLLVAGTWIMLAVVLRGFGYLLRRVFRNPETVAGDWHIDAWTGWGASIIFLQIWHIFLPVDWRTFSIVCTSGILGSIWAVAASRTEPWPGPSRRAVATTLIFALTTIWLANHAVRQPAIRDTGLYHLNAVRWAVEYPVVPGLGNLHGRLAFNNSFFLYAAMLDVGPFAHKSHQLVVGLLMLLVIWRCLQGLVHLMIERDNNGADLYYALFLAPVVVWCVASGHACSLSPDAAVYLLGLVTVGALISDRSDPAQENSVNYRLGAIASLAAVGVTVKLSFAVFAAALCIAAWLTARSQLRRVRPGAFAIIGLVVLSVLLPWMTRGVILSGYPLYPIPRLGFPVEWRIDAHVLVTQSDWIRSWARNPLSTPAETLNSWSWLWPWINRVASQHAPDMILPCALAVLALLIRRCRTAPATSRGASAWTPVAVPIVALVAWFFSAPDPRFAGSYFWIVCILVMTVALAGMEREALRIIVCVYSVVLVALQVNPIRFLHTWKDPGPAHVAEVVARTTDSGLTVWVPKEGDQCWDSPLPSTPYFSPILELRDPTDMGKGFRKRHTR